MHKTTWISLLILIQVSGFCCVQEVRQSRQAGPGFGVPVPYSPVGYFLRQTFQSPTLDAIRDIVMVTVLGIPLMGLMAVGGLVMLPLFGVNLGAIGLGSMTSSTSSTSSTSGIKKKKKGKRDASEVSIFGRIIDLMDNLEDLLTNQGILDQDCKYRMVCEAHLKMTSSNYTGTERTGVYEDIKTLIRKEQEIEALEWFPVSAFLFEPYVDAAQRGLEHCECANAYPKCIHFDQRIDKVQLQQLDDSSGEL